MQKEKMDDKQKIRILRRALNLTQSEHHLESCPSHLALCLCHARPYIFEQVQKALARTK